MLRRWKSVIRSCVETNRIHYVDKVLGIVPDEVFNHLHLSMVRKDCCDQRDALGHSESLADQPFPGWDFTVHEEPVKLTSI